MTKKHGLGIQNALSITSKRLFISLVLAAVSSIGYAQKPKLAVVSIDVQVEELEGQNIPELLRIQLTTYDRYQLLDRYEIKDILTAAELDPTTCLSITCLKHAGEVLKVDKVISGSLDEMGDVLYLRLRLIDVKTGVIEKETLKEFLVVPEYINSMITITLNSLFDLPNDKLLEKSLTSKNNYENSVNNPNYNVLNMSGPRMGYSFFAGNAAKVLQAPKKDGGYDIFPAMFQFGYQFEQQYLSEGKFQALFEFIPSINGLDQNLFVPSFTFLNGLRNNENGFEFAVGPNISFVKKATFYEINDVWTFVPGADRSYEELYESEKRMDSRGTVDISASVIIAVGTSFRSGKMNIPLNVFVVPSKQNFRFGVSFGFNAKG